MAELPIDPVDYLNKLPTFDGKVEDVQIFCSMIDRIYPFLKAYNNVAQPVFIDIIKSKLKGEAKLISDINCQAVSWPEIKTILVNNFSDTKSCEDLYDDLRNTCFKKNCVEFYNELREKLRRLNNKTLTVTGVGTTLNESTSNNRRTALKIFKSRIPEPMKSILVCRDPDTLEKAMNILFNTGYAYYNKNYINTNMQSNNNEQFVSQQKNNYNNASSNTNRRNYTRNYDNNPRNNSNNGDRFNRNNYTHNNAHTRQQNNTEHRNNFASYQSFDNRQTGRSNSATTEPMEVSNLEIHPENFRSVASEETYHI